MKRKLLSLLVLLLNVMGGVNLWAASIPVIDPAKEVTPATSDLDGMVLIVADATSGKVYKNPDSWQVKAGGTAAEAGSWTYNYLKFIKYNEEVDGVEGDLYRLQFVNADGSANYRVNLGAWYEGYFNADSESSLVALGKNEEPDHSGNKTYSGTWKVTYVDGKGYTIQNVKYMLSGGKTYATPNDVTLHTSTQYVKLYSGFGEQASSNITWNIKNDKDEIVRTIVKEGCEIGQNYSIGISLPGYTFSSNASVTATVEDQTLDVTYTVDNENVAFKLSSDYENAIWYTVTLRKYYLSWDAGADKFVCPHNEGNKTQPAPLAKKDLFAFVGSDPWHLKIVNAALGEDIAIKGSTLKGVPFNEAQVFAFEDNNNHFVFRAAETANKRLNDYNNEGWLGYWDSSSSAQDDGSSFTFDEIDPSLVEDIMNAVEPEPEPWVCPAGEIDITTLPWVKKDQDCVQDFGVGKGNIFGTDAGEGNISYVDITDYETIKVYGAPGSVVRAFINREEAKGDSKDFIFVFDAIGNDGVAALDLYKVTERLGDYGHLYLNGIKAGPNHDSKATVYGITLVEKPAPYTITTTVGKVGTIALDYPASITGATLYEVVGFNTTEGLALAEVEGDMVGGTPYIYLATADKVVCTKKGASVGHADFDCTHGNVGNGLVGCYSEVNSNTGWRGFINNCYVISNNELRKLAKGKVTIPANRCFFDPSKCTNKDASVKMQLGFAEDATAIQNVNEELDGGKIYDLNGREVKTMKKGGIYIVGGMKVSVK